MLLDKSQGEGRFVKSLNRLPLLKEGGAFVRGLSFPQYQGGVHSHGAATMDNEGVHINLTDLGEPGS